MTSAFPVNSSTYAVRYIVVGSTELRVVGGDLASGTWVSQVDSDNLVTGLRTSEDVGIYVAAMVGYGARSTVTHVSDVVQPGGQVALRISLAPGTTSTQDGSGDSTINQTVYGRWYAVRA
jgi:hypothetical protein